MESKNQDDLHPAQRERLAFIEFRLWFLGDVRRPDLMDRFDIAPAVATRDLGAYRELAPQNIDFDSKRKVYAVSYTHLWGFQYNAESQLSFQRWNTWVGHPSHE